MDWIEEKFTQIQHRSGDTLREKLALLAECVEALSDENRNTIEARYLDGCSLPAIAKRLDIARETVKKRLYRAKAQRRSHSRGFRHPTRQLNARISGSHRQPVRGLRQEAVYRGQSLSGGCDRKPSFQPAYHRCPYKTYWLFHFLRRALTLPQKSHPRDTKSDTFHDLTTSPFHKAIKNRPEKIFQAGLSGGGGDFLK